MRKGNRAQKLIDIGSTTAISAMVEIIADKEGCCDASGVLARQARAMIDRLEVPADRVAAIEGFCDELQTWFESFSNLATEAERQRGRRAA